MPNLEHVALVLQGPKATSDWRSANDWAKLDLSGADFSGMNLERIELGGCNLSGANFRGSNLGGATMWNADLTGADFTGAKMRGVALSNSILTGTILTGAELDGSYFQKSEMLGVALDDTILDHNRWFASIENLWDEADLPTRTMVVNLLVGLKDSSIGDKNRAKHPEVLLGRKLAGSSTFSDFTWAWKSHAVSPMRVLSELWARRQLDLRALDMESCPQ